jgi:glucose-6-phosphate isomerase
MPVVLALISIWYINFFAAGAQVIAPYSQRLAYLVSYFQQLQMESNGKQVNILGQTIDYATGPVLFGEAGCNAQHTYHQLLHQGAHLVPIDFILTGDSSDVLIASAVSQAQALMHGQTKTEIYSSLLNCMDSPESADQLAAYRSTPGNRPSNLIFLSSLTPRTLGALIALYEHKTYVQSVIWEINSFDQWGVELGKQLLPGILKQLQSSETTSNVEGLINYIRTTRKK